MMIAPGGYKPRQWLFDVEQQIKSRSTNPLRFVEGRKHTLTALIAMRDARRVARTIALRAVASIAKQTKTREQQQRALNELIDTLGGAWLRGQQNHSHSIARKPDACASNGQLTQRQVEAKREIKSRKTFPERSCQRVAPTRPKPRARKGS
jgi:hypothetical protein